LFLTEAAFFCSAPDPVGASLFLLFLFASLPDVIPPAPTRFSPLAYLGTRFIAPSLRILLHVAPSLQGGIFLFSSIFSLCALRVPP
jgi:hypothetical protein